MKYIKPFIFTAFLSSFLLLTGCVTTQTSTEQPVKGQHQTMYGTEDPNDHSGIPQSILDGEEEI